jgi:quercetin dioxygenase-like cupin family protein
MPTYQRVSEVSPYQIWDGATARAVHGERVTVGIIDLDPDVFVPEHRHGNEQVGFVIRGAVTMEIDGDERLLIPGDMYSIRGSVPHSAKAGPEGATVVDVFAPVRADWETAPRLSPSPGKWPS